MKLRKLDWLLLWEGKHVYTIDSVTVVMGIIDQRAWGVHLPISIAENGKPSYAVNIEVANLFARTMDSRYLVLREAKSYYTGFTQTQVHQYGEFYNETIYGRFLVAQVLQ